MSSKSVHQNITQSGAASKQNGPDAEKIRSMFSQIAGQYDLANTVLSGGIHHLWRKAVVRWSGARSGQKVLDCATGTGDLAIEFRKAVGPTGSVLGTDFCAEMMIPAPAKAAKHGFDIKFEQADVTKLPYSDNSFNVASIAFGIRNVNDPVKGLSELARVTKPGGVVMVLEFGQPSAPVIGPAYRFYSRFVLPKIGGWVTGRPEAYKYLQDSSEQFPCRGDFLRLMEKTGRFASMDYKTLSCGIAYIYKGVVK